MVSLRCKKILSTLFTLFIFVILLISMYLDDNNQQNEYTDILLVIAFILLPLSVLSTIYYCGIMENINTIANVDT